MSAIQDKLDALSASLDSARSEISASATGIQSDLADLKAQVQALTDGQNVDFTAIDASVAGFVDQAATLAALDAENPAPPA